MFLLKPIALILGAIAVGIVSRFVYHWRNNFCPPPNYKLLCGRRRAGVGDADDDESSSESVEIECAICLETKRASEQTPVVILQQCGHECCAQCLTAYLHSVCGDLSKYPLRCFAHQCHSKLEASLIETLLANNHSAIDFCENCDDNCDQKKDDSTTEFQKGDRITTITEAIDESTMSSSLKKSQSLSSVKVKKSSSSERRSVAVSSERRILSQSLLGNPSDDDDSDEAEEKESAIGRDEIISTMDSTTPGSSKSIDYLKTYRRFHALSQIPPGLRLQCPNTDGCDAVMSLDSEYYGIVASDRTPAKDHSADYSFGSDYSPDTSSGKAKGRWRHQVSDKKANEKECRQCTVSFGWLSKWKYSCPFCRHRFCHECVSAFSAAVPELDYDEAVCMCEACFALLFRRVCHKCHTPLCTRCQCQWHPGVDCCHSSAAGNLSAASGSVMHTTAAVRRKEERESKRLMKAKGWQKCPGCESFIEKNGGCNHMQHAQCPQSKLPTAAKQNEYYSGHGTTTHFCYCCGELLFQYHNEIDGSTHFTKGLFKDCRKAHLKLRSGQCSVM